MSKNFRESRALYPSNDLFRIREEPTRRPSFVESKTSAFYPYQPERVQHRCSPPPKLPDDMSGPPGSEN